MWEIEDRLPSRHSAQKKGGGPSLVGRALLSATTLSLQRYNEEPTFVRPGLLVIVAVMIVAAVIVVVVAIEPIAAQASAYLTGWMVH